MGPASIDAGPSAARDRGLASSEVAAAIGREQIEKFHH